MFTVEEEQTGKNLALDSKKRRKNYIKFIYIYIYTDTHIYIYIIEIKYIHIYIYIIEMKLVGEMTLAEKKNLSEMIRKFAEIQGSWRKQKRKGLRC